MKHFAFLFCKSKQNVFHIHVIWNHVWTIHVFRLKRWSVKVIFLVISYCECSGSVIVSPPENCSYESDVSDDGICFNDWHFHTSWHENKQKTIVDCVTLNNFTFKWRNLGVRLVRKNFNHSITVLILRPIVMLVA